MIFQKSGGVVMRKGKIIIIIILLLILTVGCSNNNTTQVDKQNDKQKEITILITGYDYEYMKISAKILLNYKQRFEREKGVKINFDIITASNADDYDKKKNIKLYLNDGPTLIFISEFEPYKNYIEQGIAVDIKGKIPNLEKVYNGLIDDESYFVPIGMSCLTTTLNRYSLEKLGIDKPKPDWTRDDYLSIKEKWLKLEPEHFTGLEYWELLIPALNELDILDELNKKVSLNNSKAIDCINDVRKEIFSDKYILNEDYTYENYYNMIFEKESEEYKNSKYLEQYFDSKGLTPTYSGSSDGLKSLEVSDVIGINNDIVLPDVVYGEDEIFWIWGFIVNRNGKNIELGMEFINGLLKDDVQLEMFTQEYSAYPVNKEIEDEISKIEEEKSINEKAVELRKYILSQIKTGNYRRSYSSKKKEEMLSMLYKDFAKYIFADEPYSDKELGNELQKLEDKYNMWLNE